MKSKGCTVPELVVLGEPHAEHDMNAPCWPMAFLVLKSLVIDSARPGWSRLSGYKQVLGHWASFPKARGNNTLLRAAEGLLWYDVGC